MKILPEITLHITPAHFEFRYKEKNFSLEPFINFDLIADKVIPVTIGENKEIPGLTLINLLDPKETFNKDEKHILFQFFMEYGIGKCFEKNFFPTLRPVVVFKGDKQLEILFCGYQRFFLERITLLSGASAVRFE